MKGLFIGRAIPGLQTCFSEHGIEIRSLSDVNKITLLFPFPGYLYYNDRKIDISDYDFVLFTGANRICRYLYTILSPIKPVFCNPQTRNIFLDKIRTSLILSNNGFEVARSVYSSETPSVNAINELSDTIVSKPYNGSLGVGCIKENKEELTYRNGMVYQDYLREGEDKNVDERWLVVDGKLQYAIKRSAKDGEFQTTHLYGGNYEVLPLTEDMIEFSKRIYDLFPDSIWIGLDIFRFDNNGKNRFVVGEINPRPSAATAKVANHSFYEDVYNYVMEHLKK